MELEPAVGVGGARKSLVLSCHYPDTMQLLEGPSDPLPGTDLESALVRRQEHPVDVSEHDGTRILEVRGEQAGGMLGGGFRADDFMSVVVITQMNHLEAFPEDRVRAWLDLHTCSTAAPACLPSIRLSDMH